VAVHAYRTISGASPRDGVAGLSRATVEAMRQRGREIAIETLEAAVASTRAGRDAVEVELAAEEGSASSVLVEHARHPDSELVVGRWSGGGPVGRLGLISQACLRQAGGPVVVVPHAD